MAFSLRKFSDCELFNYYLSINISNICRICLEKSGTLLPIFDTIKPPHFSELIMACASVQVLEGDGMPPYICQKCMSKLNVAFQFKSQCESSDAKLRQHLEHLATLSTRTDLISYVQIKKDDDTVFTVAANAADTRVLEVTVVDNITTQDIHINCLDNQIEQSRLPELENQPTQTVQELDNELHYSEIKTETPAVKVEDFQELDLDGTTATIGSREAANNINNKETISDSSNNIIDSASITLNEAERSNDFTDECRKSMKQHQCDLCGKIFRTKPSLVHHIRIHTGERPFVCRLCDKRFINGGHLHTHMRTHTGEKNHACALCPKAFATAQQLTKHTVAIHTADRPYLCTLCPKRFASSSNLGTHVKIHTGEKNYRCDKCAKAFTTKGQLFQHMLVHTREKAFLCEYCNKRFTQKAHLVRHLKIHSDGT